MYLRWLRLLLVAAMFCGVHQRLTTVYAQDDAADTGSAADAAEQYRQKFEQWKTLLKDMRTLRMKYIAAEQNEKAAIERRWEESIEEGRALIPQLRSLGQKAYAEAPGQDRQLEQFLLKLVQDDLANDRYEEAAALTQALLESGCEVKDLKDAAASAAFVTNDYESAEKFLAAAQEEGVLDAGANFLEQFQEYKQYWAEEQKLRAAEAEADDLPRVKISTTQGDLLVELFENQAPGTVGNFINLVEKGFYDGLSFHRVLGGFMAQGGCPLGTGTGGPGYNIYCECYQPDYRKHFRGTLSMAHAGKDSGGSQFFITFVPTPHLNGKHTAFGRVIEGLEVLSKLKRVDPGSEESKNVEPDRIVKMEVLRKRDHAYEPEKVN